MLLNDLTETKTPYDVVVIGGGMVGSPLALALQNAGFSTLLVEKQSFSGQRIATEASSFDRRSTAMSLGSIQILEALGLWDQSGIDACAIQHVHVSESGKMGTSKLSANALGVDRLGVVVANNSFGNFLLQRLKGHKLHVLDEVSVQSVCVAEGCASLELVRAGALKMIDAKLVIAVDGANSSTARQLGIEYHRKPYQQHALIANVETTLENDGVAYERFCQPGPIAMLPIGPNQSALVWTLPENKVDAYLSMDDATFCRELTRVFGERLGAVIRVGERVTYPLILSQAQEIFRSRVLLAGNAAHSLHPVAGQGFNLALRGVAAALEGIVAARDRSEDIGAISVLKGIAAKHRVEQQKIVHFSDQIIQIFSENSSFPTWARSLGLVGLNGVDAIKREFARHTMGRAQALQSLKQSRL